MDACDPDEGCEYPFGTFRSAFARDLDRVYRERLLHADLFRNDLILSLVWHPGRDPAERAAAFFSRLGRAARAGIEVDPQGLKKLEDATRDVVAALGRYGPRRLGLYDRSGIAFSEPMEFLHRIVSGEQLPMPLVQGPIGPALYTNRLIFGREALEIRSPSGSRFAGMLGLKEYPATTRPGLFDALLSLPLELVVTQSFAFLSKADAKTVLTRKQNQLLSSNDPAASQIGDLGQALDDLEFEPLRDGRPSSFGPGLGGDAEAAPRAHGAGPARAGGRAARSSPGRTSGWRRPTGRSCQAVSNTGPAPARSRRATSRHSRPSTPIPSGQADGNHWGPAVACLKTASGTPYHFSFHAGDLGNTFICGPSGSGKTVFLTFAAGPSRKARVPARPIR